MRGGNSKSAGRLASRNSRGAHRRAHLAGTAAARAPQAGSSGFQPAVSPISNRQARAMPKRRGLGNPRPARSRPIRSRNPIRRFPRGPSRQSAGLGDGRAWWRRFIICCVADWQSAGGGLLSARLRMGKPRNRRSSGSVLPASCRKFHLPPGIRRSAEMRPVLSAGCRQHVGSGQRRLVGQGGPPRHRGGYAAQS
jgi:hypothetical protein